MYLQVQFSGAGLITSGVNINIINAKEQVLYMLYASCNYMLHALTITMYVALYLTSLTDKKWTKTYLFTEDTGRKYMRSPTSSGWVDGPGIYHGYHSGGGGAIIRHGGQ